MCNFGLLSCCVPCGEIATFLRCECMRCDECAVQCDIICLEPHGPVLGRRSKQHACGRVESAVTYLRMREKEGDSPHRVCELRMLCYDTPSSVQSLDKCHVSPDNNRPNSPLFSSSCLFERLLPVRRNIQTLPGIYD